MFLLIGHESMLYAVLEIQEAVEVLPLPSIVRLNNRRILAFG